MLPCGWSAPHGGETERTSYWQDSILSWIVRKYSFKVSYYFIRFYQMISSAYEEILNLQLDTGRLVTNYQELSSVRDYVKTSEL